MTEKLTNKMKRIDSFKIRMPDGSIKTHPAFFRDGKEIPCFYVGEEMEMKFGEHMIEPLLKRINGKGILTIVEADAVARYENMEQLKGGARRE